jgi:hypothetical protein
MSISVIHGGSWCIRRGRILSIDGSRGNVCWRKIPF